jgi:cobalt-zinc-cadmium resistance protein CzcA
MAENGYPLNVFGVQQNFNFPTVYSSQNKANRIDISISEKELTRQKQILARDVSQVYYEITYLLNRQQVYSRIDSLYRSFNPMMEKKLDKGDISRLDLLNTQAKQHQVSEIINQIRLNIATANEKLKSLVQSDTAIEVPLQNLEQVAINEINLEATPGIQLMKMQNEYQNARLKVERNRLFPDFSLSYFNGTNSYAGSKNYQGFQVGMSVPLFFGEQNAKIKSNKIALSINETLQTQELIQLESKLAALKNELSKSEEAIHFYQTIGKQLSEEILRSSQRSYEMGEIEYFQFVLSVENALALTLDYYENVSRYNYAALEINYLTN